MMTQALSAPDEWEVYAGRCELRTTSQLSTTFNPRS